MSDLTWSEHASNFVSAKLSKGERYCEECRVWDGDCHHGALRLAQETERLLREVPAPDEPDEPPASPDESEEPTYLDKLRAALVDSAGLDNIADPEPLIGEDLLFRDCLVWMVGKPGCMKSFTALDMAGCVATGEPWQGWQVRQGKVLYLVAEGVAGTKKRVRAWEKAMGRNMDGVTFLPVAVQSKIATQWAALVTVAQEIQPAMVVIDTQARVTVGVEENSNTEMGVFVDQAERLRKATGACVLIVHHIGKSSDGGRGATTVEGAVNTIIKVVKDEHRVTLECTKNKDGTQWEDIKLRAIPTGDSIVLGLDDGTGPSDTYTTLTSKPWIQEWWRTFEREPTSASRLINTTKVPETTFYRTYPDLKAQGIAVKEGNGNATRYRLIVDPTAG